MRNLLLFFSCVALPLFAQNGVVAGLVDFYRQADKECYVSLIQKDIDDYNVWLRDSFPLRVANYEYPYNVMFAKPGGKPTSIRLANENVRLVLRICFRDMDDYNCGDDLYSHIIVDSMYTFSAAVLDGDSAWIGQTDYEEKGSYRDFLDPTHVNYRFVPLMENSFRQVWRHFPETDVFLMCDHCSDLLFVRGDSIYTVNHIKGFTELTKCFSQDFPMLGREYYPRAPIWRQNYGGFGVNGKTTEQEIRLCR